MKHLITLFILLFIGAILMAQDTLDVLGSEACELSIDMQGIGNASPVYVAVSQNDLPIADFQVFDGEEYLYSLPPGTRSYRIVITTADEDQGDYTLGAQLDCPETHDAGQVETESPNAEAWLYELAAQVPPEYQTYITVDYLRLIAQGDPDQGYGPDAAIELVRLLNLVELEAPPTAEPTPEATSDSASSQD